MQFNLKMIIRPIISFIILMPFIGSKGFTNLTETNTTDLNMKNIQMPLNNYNLTESEKKLESLIISKKVTAKLYNKTGNKRWNPDKIIPIDYSILEWKCPNITKIRSLECGCDLPHTLRCSGDIHGLEILANDLRQSPFPVSLLDCTLRNVTFLSDAKIFENISLHGLVISSGEIKRVHKKAFLGLSSPLQALGLPSNALISVPWNSISSLVSLERLDLSNNKIKAIGGPDFSVLRNLTYLELTDNQISSVSLRSFTNLKKLEILKLGGNRLGDYPISLQALGQCFNLRQLDLKSNIISGPLNKELLPPLLYLEILNLDKNLIKSIQNKALENFQHLKILSLQHNQIDVLQDHAFYGLGVLEILDLSFNGIVAISSASLQHLPRLKILDLTHNFLRALTSDLIVPLISLEELRLAGNDISIVAKNALDGAKELTSLAMQENPLSCDCSIIKFAEWLSTTKMSSQDLLSAICATPPHLEGAPLIQVPIQSLSCDTNNIETDNANIVEQMEAISRDNTSTHIKDFSEKVFLRELHFSADYGIMLSWIVNLSNDDYMCDSIFVYKETNIHEILIDSSQIHCESKMVSGQNTVSVIVPDSELLEIGESYRFCLVLIPDEKPNSDLLVGCSNITKLEKDGHNNNNWNRNLNINQKLLKSNFSNVEKISQNNNNIARMSNDKSKNSNHTSMTESNDKNSYIFVNRIDRNFLPGLSLGILITSIFVFLWGAAKIRNNSRQSTNVTTCYTAPDRAVNITDLENRKRYLKLQATTSL